MPEQDPSVQHDRQALLQRVVAQVTEDHAGEDLHTVHAALLQGLQAQGFPEQPEKWVSDTASEIAEARHVVVDRELAVSGGPGADEVPDEAGDASR